MLGRIFRWGGSDAYARGIAAYNAGDLEGALTYFEAVLQRHTDPSHPDVTLASFYRAEAHRRLASASIESGDFAVALAHLDQAVEDQPSYPDLHFRRGVVLLQMGDALAAEESARRALEKNAGFIEAGLLQVLALDAQGSWGRRDDVRRKWLEQARAEGHPLARVLAEDSPRPDALLEHLRSVHRRRERAVRAESYQRQGLHDDARRLLLELVDENPDYPDLRVRLATAEFALSNAREAQRHVDAALALNPGFEEARLLDAVLSIWSNDLASVDQRLQGLLDRPRVGASARYALAVRHLLVGQPQSARDLLRSVSAERDRAESLEALDAATEYQMGHRRRSREIYEGLLHPGVSMPVLLDAVSCALADEDVALARRGRDLLPAEAVDAVCLVARARVHQLEGDLDTGIDLLETATARDPRSGALLFALAELYAARGDFTAAGRRLLGLMVSGRSLEESRVLLARCHRHDGEAGEALACLREGEEDCLPSGELALERLFALRLLQRGDEAQRLWERRHELLPLDHRWRVQSARRWLAPLVSRTGAVEERQGEDSRASREPLGGSSRSSSGESELGEHPLDLRS